MTRTCNGWTDTGIAEVLTPHIEGGWDGVLASVDRLGQICRIFIIKQ